MKVISINTNGIRAAAKKGFFEWLKAENADFVCIQETKAQVHQLTDPVFNPKGYFCSYFDAEKKGYSGTAVYSKQKPNAIINGYGDAEMDIEGRYLEYRYDNLSVISLYAPSGSAKEQRQQVKFRFMDSFMTFLLKLKEEQRDIIICGDWNIAHNEIDLKNWKNNRNNSGFLPEERAWLTELFDEVGYVDAFRELEKGEDQFTWWSQRGAAYDNNVGWRIDYQIISPSLKDKLTATRIYKDNKFSDHAPLIIEYDYNL
ncbi:MAG: exodeoxyribonuclease III [Gammaproteobacteria bacterium]|nr:exodeoxyribonuclease III [Gammaproteobacteria bacterium]